MDELKNTVVSATQGGLDLDSDLHAIADGDGRDRRNVMIYDNGRVDKSKGFTNVYDREGTVEDDDIFPRLDAIDIDEVYLNATYGEIILKTTSPHPFTAGDQITFIPYSEKIKEGLYSFTGVVFIEYDTYFITIKTTVSETLTVKGGCGAIVEGLYTPNILPPHDVVSSCSDEDGNVYVLAHTSGVFRIYKDDTKVFESTDALFDPTKYVQFEAHDGYWFITQSGYEPLMIDISREYIKGYEVGALDVSASSPYDVITFVIGYYDSLFLQEGDTISFIPNSNGIANGAMYYNGVIDSLSYEAPATYVYCTTDARKYVSITGTSGVIVKGTHTYYPIYDNLTTIKPIPLKAPEVEMVSDPTISYNNFVENTYVFGYTVIYDDDYETPMSPLSVVNLESLSVSSIQRSNVNAYNKARIYIVPPPTAKKVKLFVKKNSESENFYRISTNDFQNEIAVGWDGSLAADVYSNTEWAKGFESVPISAKAFSYLSDDRIVYGGCREGYDCDEPKIFVKYTNTEYDADITTTNIASYLKTGTTDNAYYYDLIGKMGWSSITETGYMNWSVSFWTRINYGTFTRSYAKINIQVLVDLEIGDSKADVLNKIVDKINAKYGVMSGQSDLNKIMVATVYNTNYVKIKPIAYPVIYQSTDNGASGSYTFGQLVFQKTLKTGYEEQFGIVWKDRAGRSSGVLTNESCKITFPEYESTEIINVAKPIIYLNATPPSWATCYQFVVKRNLKSWSQHLVPCEQTQGSWDVAPPVNSLGIRKFVTAVSNVYGIAFNRIIDANVEGGYNQLVYNYKEGDYVKLIRTYTATGWSNNGGSELFRITGSKVDGGITYFMIDDTDDNFASVYSAYQSVSNTYLQFEVVNVGDITLTSENIWNEIGESYGLIGVGGYGQREGDTYTYPEDGQSYFFYEHEVDYGRAVIRPVYRGNLDLDDYVEWIFYVESEYIFESSNKKLLITGRAHTITDNTQRYRNIIRNGGRKFDGTEIDNRRVFDYLDYSDLGENYGDVSGIAQRGNTVRVYCPRKTGSIYLNANEMSNQDGTTNLIYNSKVLGTLRWSNQKYGCTDARSIFSTGDDIYFFDSINKKFIKDTQGGMFCISSKDQQYDGKVDSFFKSITGDVIVGYDPIYRVVYVTADDTIAFLEDYGRWFTFFDIEPLGYFVAVNKLYSYNTYGVFQHNTQGLVSYNSLGVQSDVDGELDLVIAPERINGKNYEAVVLHSDNKSDVYVNCYTKNWSDDLYTKIPSGTFKEWDGMYYADVTKGGKEGTFKSYMMYAGNDMVGKVGIFKVVGDVSLSGLEVRYSIRNR